MCILTCNVHIVTPTITEFKHFLHLLFATCKFCSLLKFYKKPSVLKNHYIHVCTVCTTVHFDVVLYTVHDVNVRNTGRHQWLGAHVADVYNMLVSTASV